MFIRGRLFKVLDNANALSRAMFIRGSKSVLIAGPKFVRRD